MSECLSECVSVCATPPLTPNLLVCCVVMCCAGDQSTFDFFRQETSHKDVVIRTEAMNRLALVCAVMTPEKVRGDMMPYLQSE